MSIRITAGITVALLIGSAFLSSATWHFLARALPARRPDIMMDRAFTVPAPPAAVWPWLVQLGKKRAGWYLPGRAEGFVPRFGSGQTVTRRMVT